MKRSPTTQTPTNAAVEFDSIRSPNGYHAFLVATVELEDPGKGRLVQLKFLDGTVFQALVASDVLRLGNLNGTWRATLHFTSNPNGSLQSPLRVQRLRPRASHVEMPATFWSIAGDIEHLDTGAARVSLRTLTSRQNPTFFVNTIQLSKNQFEVVQANPLSTCLMQGSLEQGVLVAQHISTITIRTPRKSSLNSNPQEGSKHHESKTTT